MKSFVDNHISFLFAVNDGDEIMGLLRGVVISNGKKLKDI